ncbi:MAG TPA: hypothetical protein VG815_15885 [Chloroflexota bacterium]|jgi:plasmid stability protein|nr:hypothetical protein [Chloroflexota bacterium]
MVVAKSTQVRNVPESVHTALKVRAAAARLSLSEYLLRELVEIAERPSVAEVLCGPRDLDWGSDLQAIVEVVRAGRDHPDGR